MSIDFSYFYLELTWIFYMAAMFFHVVTFFDLFKAKHDQGFLMIRLGFITCTLFLSMEALAHGLSFPMQGISHIFAFFAWSLSFAYLFFFSRIQNHAFGLILSPILFGLTMGAFFLYGTRDFEVEVSAFFALHIISAYFAYASIAISFAAAVLYLIQHLQLKKRNAGTFYHKLPSLESLEKLTFQPMVWGVLLLALASFIGVLWTKEAYGQWWVYSDKSLATFLALLGYLVLILLRNYSKLRYSRISVLNIIFFMSLVLVFVLRKVFL